MKTLIIILIILLAGLAFIIEYHDQLFPHEVVEQLPVVNRFSNVNSWSMPIEVAQGMAQVNAMDEYLIKQRLGSLTEEEKMEMERINTAAFEINLIKTRKILDSLFKATNGTCTQHEAILLLSSRGYWEYWK